MPHYTRTPLGSSKSYLIAIGVALLIGGIEFYEINRINNLPPRVIVVQAPATSVPPTSVPAAAVPAQ